MSAFLRNFVGAMNLEYVVDEQSPRLLLIFAGWSTDASVFQGLSCEGYDIAVVSDYRDCRLPDVGQRQEIVAVAWSLGVAAASSALAESNLPVTLTVAVNGTPTPVDDLTGIPTEIYQATADTLSETSLAKFRRRMGGANLPRGARTIDRLQEELRAVAALTPRPMRWDRAVVSEDDRIFPPQNQLRAWANLPATVVHRVSGAHCPQSWQSLIDALVVEKPLVSRRFSRSVDTYSQAATVQQRIAEHLWQLWQKHIAADVTDLLEIGFGAGTLTRLYARRFASANISLWDIIQLPAPLPDAQLSVCDGESRLIGVEAESLDVIVSASTAQWFNSLPAFLLRAERALRKGGLLVLSTFGEQNYRQLTAAGVTPLPYLSEEQIRACVPSGMAIEELHSGIITKMFDSPLDVLAHLRATGVNARRSSVSVQRIIRDYPVDAASGRAALTYHPVYLILRKQ